MKKMVITIVTAYPTEGAGSGTLITAQAKTYVEMGYEVHIITANNNTGFKKLDGVQYHLVPFAADKVQLVRNGCDTSVFYKEDVDAKEVLTRLNSNVTPDGKIPTDYDKMALFVGKFAGFKRVDLVLNAAKIYEEKMKEKGQNVLTLIVGAGALDEELKKQQKSLGLKNS